MSERDLLREVQWAARGAGDERLVNPITSRPAVASTHRIRQSTGILNLTGILRVQKNVLRNRNGFDPCVFKTFSKDIY